MPAYMRKAIRDSATFYTPLPTFFVRVKARTSAVTRTRDQATEKRDLFFCSPFPVLPPSANRSVACFFVFEIRIQISSHHPSLTPLFPPLDFLFPLNSLTLTPLHPPSPLAHIHLAHTPRYLICGLGSQIVALRFGSRSFLCHREPWVQNPPPHKASMRAGSRLPACLAHPSETWDGLTLGWETSPTWKESYATSHTYLPLSTAVTVKSVGLSRYLFEAEVQSWGLEQTKTWYVVLPHLWVTSLGEPAFIIRQSCVTRQTSL